MKKNAKRFTILARLLGILIVALVVMIAVTTTYSAISLKKGMQDETLEGVYNSCVSLNGAMNAIDKGDYFVDNNGMLNKGLVAIGYKEAYLDQFVEGTELELTMFFGEKRMLTTLVDETGKRMVGSTCSPEVKAAVLDKGEVYEATNLSINGKNYYAVYMPAKDSTGNVVGMYFAGLPSEDIDVSISQKVINLLVIAIIVLLAVGVIGAFTINSVAKAVKGVSKFVLEIAEGDLTAEIDQKLVNRTDEVGDMAKAMEAMDEKLKEIIGEISGITKDIINTGTELDETAEQTSHTADEISAAVEDISKGAVSQAEDIEEATVAVGEMGAGFEQIIDSVGNLNASADKMLDADEASEKIIGELVDSNEETVVAIKEVAKSVDETDKSVQMIQEAVTLIASIADQTNLLALNASIEAARAGEAGRGFAVVASEISKLAEESQNSANRINEIITKLSDDSKATVEEMNKMAEIAKVQQSKLHETRNTFNEVSTGIKTTIEQADLIRHASDTCNNSKNKVVDVISNLSAISEENAASSEETTASMEELNATMNLLAQTAKELQEIAVELDKNVSFFKL